MKKNDLREKYKIIRNSIDEASRREHSDKICRRICALSCVKCAQAIMNYSAVRSEVITDKISDYVLSVGKTLLLPVTDMHTQTMHASVAANLSCVAAGGYGISEPVDKAVFDGRRIDVVIVPGLVYNRRGFRIGYGKGYYDKFLSAYPSAVKIGAAYSAQLCRESFDQAHDIRVDIIVTENEVIYCEQ